MGGRGGNFAGKHSGADTSYQGKQFARASGRGQTVDMMAGALSGLGNKTLAGAPEAVQQINAAAGNPNATITIYRATIGDSINQNDWVFLDKKQADKWTKTPLAFMRLLWAIMLLRATIQTTTTTLLAVKH